ncbi:haloacid dehalogenase type II [Methylocystis sp. H4A]|nr:haloacid dehalogenase type II [Methylocystis sp. H4A]
MHIDRRLLIQGGLASMTGLRSPEEHPRRSFRTAAARFKALAFDAFPIFDPRPIDALAEALFPGNGTRLVELWRNRQFEYSWLRTASGHYVDFMKVSEEALVFAGNALRLQLSGETRDQLLHAYLTLGVWPDARPTLQGLRSAGVRLALLSNLTPDMLKGSITTSGLEGVFEHVLSTDRAKTYKPSPDAYRLGVDAFGLAENQILFVAFAGWDAAGAKAFGYPTFWVNRLGLPSEELGSKADAEGKSLADLTAYVLD